MQLQKWALPLGALGVALIVGAFLLQIVSAVRADILLLMGALGVVLVGFYILTRPRDETRERAGLRVALQGGNVILFALAFIGIVIAINYIIINQFPQRLDLTANKQHTLSQQTVQVLQTLQEPVQVIGFFTPETESSRQQAEMLLKEYQLKTTNLKVQYVDPDENPALAQKYELAAPGTLVFEKNTRTEKVEEPFDENSFTNAILKVTQTQQPAIYFTTGHGEFNPGELEDNGFSIVADYLKRINYKVEPLNLVTISETLPADTSAIVIAGPTQPFSPQNDQVLKKYLDEGGRVLLMANPNTSIGLTETLKTWGLELDNDLVLEPVANYYGNSPIPVFSQFPNSPVTENMQGLGVFFPGVRSIKELEETDKDLTALFTTTAESCAKTDFAALSEQTQLQCAENDVKGPFEVGYAVEGAGTGGANPDARSRLIVLGNASFATNQWLRNPDSEGNSQIIVNMINWLAGQEQLIAIPPRDSNVRALGVLTESELNLIFITSVALVPLAALVIGGMLWWRRR
jgi:ABC-type uncharacterized transport system involved in gliding motility auxiliary subunit